MASCGLSITQDNLAFSVCYERSVRLTHLVTAQRCKTGRNLLFIMMPFAIFNKEQVRTFWVQQALKACQIPDR